MPDFSFIGIKYIWGLSQLGPFAEMLHFYLPILCERGKLRQMDLCENRAAQNPMLIILSNKWPFYVYFGTPDF